ncbi:Nucleolar complex protein 4-like protein A [Lasiodiplodia theobromae]|uniref:Nucleolar complex protein 4-like protein A n=1 Tax=Lasiodiplodia theobromae TaxID=45133 RepID=A0A5N5D0X4_9PEZI|nr:Nucleolar complex protein 4-like protein A [Lasiodiplodia theobromae]
MAPEALAGHKRKRVVEKGAAEKRSKSKASSKNAATDGDDDEQARILLLESQITESRRHYNNIVELIKLAKDDGAEESATLAIVALCRVFCRLLVAGSMKKSKGLPDSEVMIIQWLKERYKEYADVLLQLLKSGNPILQSTALTLAMRLVKEETSAQKGSGEDAWRNGLFYQLVYALLASTSAEHAREEFVEKFIEEHDDVRFYALVAIASCLKNPSSPVEQEQIIVSSLSVLSDLEGVPESKDELENFYGPEPDHQKHQLYSLSAHKRQGQDAWLALFRSGLNKEQRKSVLNIMTYKVTPWFSKVEMLMDFLTDSYNVGGGTSLLALSGLFFLIREKNLDYPSFYGKLYSLLDEGILHSKHRSRFFRLLDEFMSSTHLPAALVASFIKRLSRLALHAPPAGIVVVVPWVYNMLMKHPACTFMIHRVIRGPEARKRLEDEGMDDPFDMEESDPMETGAIESSLWELETLQSHYHPNVATLAKIISEQFTKRSYNLEDFLDHSYNGLIEAEFGKEMKKTPVVEYEIPKRIFTADDSGLGPLGGLMSRVLETC